MTGAEVTVHGIRSATRFTDNARQTSTYRQGRVLPAGDAAHVHSPSSGQDLSLGLGTSVSETRFTDGTRLADHLHAAGWRSWTRRRPIRPRRRATGTRLTVLTLPTAEEGLAGPQAAAALLVRPDGYLAWAGIRAPFDPDNAVRPV